MAHLATILWLWSLSSHTNLLSTIQFGAIKCFFQEPFVIFSKICLYSFTNANIWFIVFQETETIHWNIKGGQVSLLEWLLACIKEGIFIVLVFIVFHLHLLYLCLVLSTKKYCLYCYLAIWDFKPQIVRLYLGFRSILLIVWSYFITLSFEILDFNNISNMLYY